MRMLRRSSWAEVELQFADAGGGFSAKRNAQGWSERYRLPAEIWPVRPVKLEAWTGADCLDVLVAMSLIEPRVSIDIVNGVNNAQIPPRVGNLPATLIRFGDRYGIIDGKHRMHQWAKEPDSVFGVLVIASAFR